MYNWTHIITVWTSLKDSAPVGATIVNAVKETNGFYLIE
jgi:hypothetical protein